MPIQSMVGRSIAYRRQTGLGVVGANDSTARVVPYLDGTNLQLTKSMITSEEVTPTFQTSTARHGNRAVSGEIQGQAQCGTYSALMEAALRRDFTLFAPLAANTGVTAAVLTANTGTFTRAAGSWISDGIRVGHLVRMSGWTTTGANNNARNFTVTGLTATVMTVAGVVAAKAAGDSVVVSVPGRTTWMPVTGHSSPYFTVEEWNPDVPASFRFTDCRVNTMAMSLQPNAVVTANFGLIGRDRTFNASRYFSSASTAAQSAMMVGHQGLVVVNGTPSGIVTGLNFTATNNAEPGPAIGTNVAFDVFYGRMSVSGQVTVYFDSSVLDSAFDAETDISIIAQVAADSSINSDCLQVCFPRIKPAGGSFSTVTQSRVQTFDFTALQHPGTLGNEATTMLLQDTSLT